jgi:O-antigen ligase
MSKGSIQSVNDRRNQAPTLLSVFAIPVLACVFTVIISPLVVLTTHERQLELGAVDTAYHNKFFWPALAAVALILALPRLSHISMIIRPPHMMAFLAYFGFAGVTVLWAYAPEISLTRYIQQTLIVTSIVVPTLLSNRRTDVMHGLFLCFALALLLNMYNLVGDADAWLEGYRGYFTTKNELGAFSAVALLLALHELSYPGRRRIFGTIVGIAAVGVLVVSSSKTALGFALLAPMAAALAVAMRRTMRLSPLLLPVSIVVVYFILSSITNFSTSRVSYLLTGEPTFTGRETIWQFSSYQISQHPLLGWGYRSFWMVGPHAPSVTEAPGWVKTIVNSHSGYYDTLLELGYVGFVLLLIFLATTLHAIGHVVDREPRRGWALLSIAFFVICANGLESSWMRGYEMLWVVFLVTTAETARHWKSPRVPRRLQVRQSQPGPVNRRGPQNATVRPVS